MVHIICKFGEDQPLVFEIIVLTQIAEDIFFKHQRFISVIAQCGWANNYVEIVVVRLYLSKQWVTGSGPMTHFIPHDPLCMTHDPPD